MGPGLDLAARRSLLSTQRGLGPVRQSEPLNHKKVLALNLSTRPLAKNGPLNPMAVHVMGTLFLTRELEAALAQRNHLTMNHRDFVVTWLLPVTKTDPEARGCKRSWPCVCDDLGTPFKGCPYHQMVPRLELLSERFGPPVEERKIYSHSSPP